MDLQEEERAAAAAGRPRGRRTGTERFLIGLTAVLFVSSVVLVASLVYVVTSDSSGGGGGKVELPGNRSQREEASRRTMGVATVPEQFQEVCVTPGCVAVSSHLLRSRDPAVPPCEDFYGYACGGWQRWVRQLRLAGADDDYRFNAEQPHRMLAWKQIELLSSPANDSVHGFRKAKKFFKFCKENLPASRQKLEAAADHILSHTLGGFRSAAGWAARPGDLTQLLVQLHRLQGEPLFSAQSVVLPSDRSRLAVMLTLPDFDPLEDAGRRRHGTARRRPWAREFVAPGRRRRRRRVGSVAGDPTEGLQPTGPGDQEQDLESDPVSVSRLFDLVKETVVSEHIDSSVDFFERFVSRNKTSEFGDEDKLIHDWRDIKRFLSKLAKIMPSHRERADVETNGSLMCQHPMTLEDMQLEYPFVNWTVFLKAVLTHDVSDSDVVCVVFPQYLVDLDLMLLLFPPRIVYNSVLLMYRTDYLESRVLELSAAEGSEDARTLACAEYTLDQFPVPLAGMVVRDVGRQRVNELRAKVLSLLSEIKDELIRSIEQKHEQAPSPVYKMALAKLRKLRSLVCASESFWNDRFINDNTPNLQHLMNTWQKSDQPGEASSGRYPLLKLIRVSSANERAARRRFLQADFDAEDTIWSYIAHPHTVNAFYLIDRNAVVIPLGYLLSEPYKYTDVPHYVTYGALGSTLAHEILHSFGVNGFLTDETGVSRELPEAVAKQLEEMRHCVRHNFTRNLSRVVRINDVPFSAEPNGDLTLDENLSDHDILPLLWRAYNRWQHWHGAEPGLPGVDTTVQKSFLLTFAQTFCAKVAPLSYVSSSEMDEHLQNPERVNAIVRQWPGFAAAFECQLGSPMAPAERCPPLWQPT